MECTVEFLREIIGEKLGIEKLAVDPETAFFTLGVTSIISEEILSILHQEYQNLSATLLFEYPNINKLSQFLALQERKSGIAQDLSGKDKQIEVHVVNELVTTKHAISTDILESSDTGANVLDDGKSDNANKAEKSSGYDIAIIGLSGKFPKANDQFEYWRNLVANRDCIEEIPEDKWNYLAFYSKDKDSTNTTYSKWGGFIDDVDKFDPLFFGISPKEAELMDPQQKLFLTCCWEAMEDAGYGKTEYQKARNIGVFAGVTWNEFSLCSHEEGYLQGQYKGPGSLYWSIPNRVSYFLDLTGPSMAIDTACSSSLVAIHQACQAILANDCEMALAGGVNLSLHPNKYISLSQSNFLSTDGKCRSFGEGGDGYVPGEGVGTILLKPLAKAVADGDYIYGVIRGSATNHGGKTRGYTVPNPESHRDLIVTAIERAQIHPGDLTYMECHGTGTALGDPIEVRGLTLAFDTYTQKKHYCGIGSVKSNIGHLEAAAGVVGLIKVLLSMKNKILPASIHAQVLNRKIDFNNSPFFVIQDNQEWEPQGGKSLFAAVSSFGAGGTNAHIIVESFNNNHRSNPADGNFAQELIMLSAQTEGQLMEYAEKMVSFISRLADNPSEIQAYNLRNIAKTLQTGRESYRYRLAILATSLPELQQNLQNHICGNIDNKRKFSGEVLESKVTDPLTVRTLPVVNQDMEMLASLWVKGDVENDQMDTETEFLKVPLPTYPLLKEKSWITKNGVYYDGKIQQVTHSVLHPLLDVNISTLKKGQFKKAFSNQEYFLKDHLINNHYLLPGVCHLEMASAGGALWGERDVIKIKNIWFSHPIVVGESPEEVEIEFIPEGEDIHYRIKNASESGSSRLFSQGIINYKHWGSTAQVSIPINLATYKATYNKILKIDEFYQLFVRIGIIQKSSFQVIREFFFNDAEAFAKITLPPQLEHDFPRYRLHPALMDGAVQTAMAQVLLSQEDAALIVPFYFGQIQILKPLTPTIYVHAVLENPLNNQFKLMIFDDQGVLAVEVQEFIVKEVNERQGFAQSAATLLNDEQCTEVIENSLENYLYLPEWIPDDIVSGSKELVLPPATLEASKKSIMIIYPESEPEVGLALSQGCQNDNLITVELSSSTKRESEVSWKVDVNNATSFDQVFQHLKSLDTIYFLGGVQTVAFDINDLEKFQFYQERGVISLFRLVKSLIRFGFASQPLELKVVTNNVHQVLKDDKIKPSAASLYGLARVIAAEFWQIKVGSLDITIDDTEFGQNQLQFKYLAQIIYAEPSNEDGRIVAIREGKRYKQVLSPALLSPVDTSLLKRQGVYVIVGGAGGIGLALSRFLAENVQARLVLIGRSDLNDYRKQAIAEVEANGGQVLYLQADVTDYEVMNAVMQRVKSEFGRINGVIHSALVLQDKTIEKMDEEMFHAVFDPKVTGSVVLHKVLQDEPLDFMLFFSSDVSFRPSSGQSNYTAANAFKDAFALYLNQNKPYPVKVINWSYWGSVGVAATEEHNRRLSALGYKSIEPNEGMEVVRRVLGNSAEQIIFLKAKEHFLQKMGISLLSRIQRYSPGIANNDPLQVGSPAMPGASLTRQDLLIRTQEYVKSVFSEVLHIEQSRIDSRATFERYGVDSVLVIELNKKFAKDFGKLPSTLLFENMTIEKLSEYFIEHYSEIISAKIGGSIDFSGNYAIQDLNGKIEYPGSNTEIPPSGLLPQNRIHDIAIIGVSGRYPMAADVDEFWENLLAGKDCITEIPEERWDFNQYYVPFEEYQKGKTYSKWGGFIANADKFDPLLFKITPRDAKHMDPQQRLFLEAVWATLEDAGYTKNNIEQNSGKRAVGVFVGSMWNDYQLLAEDEFNNENELVNAYLNWGIANRVSYHFDFHGPSVSIDSACSSSLTAIKMACDSIRRGECQVAVAGGVNLSLHPSKYIKLSQDKYLSSDGKCRSFGENGNGYVPGEGVGALLLKPLKAAKSDGDHIYGIIKGASQNHGGKTKGFTVPNLNVQADLIIDALSDAAVNPTTITYVECHGTGTALGDPIEIRGLTKAFENYVTERQGCPIGSVKSNIGHLEAASGIASVTKILLMIKYQKLVPSLHAEKLNPFIDFEATPFYVHRSASDWSPAVQADANQGDEKYPRRAAVSSFGAGGSNTHLVLEEYEEEHDFQNYVDYQNESPAEIIILSAKDTERLKVYAVKFRDFLQKELFPKKISTFSPKLSLGNIAYTLQIGREALEERVAIVVRSKEELSHKLDGFIESGKGIEGLFTGNTGKSKNKEKLLDGNPDHIMDLFRKQQFFMIAESWVAGTDIKWDEIYQQNSLKRLRISLPTYPFARERHWLSGKHKN